MATTINADTSNGLKITSDTSGVIEFQSAGTTKAGVNSTGLTGDGSQLTGLASGIEWQSSIVTAATLTAVAGRGYWINTTSNACTITLPSSASVGDELVFTDYARTWGTNNVIIDSNGLNFQSKPDTDIITYLNSGESINIVYSGATQGWIPNVVNTVPLQPVTPYAIDYLVVGGGGGGGLNSGRSEERRVGKECRSRW